MNVLRMGEKGSAVTALQERLVVHRCLPGDQVDGDFGPVTKRAVVQFQTKRGLEADGVVGMQTWTALTAAPALGSLVMPGQTAFQTALLAVAQDECSRGVREIGTNRGREVEKYLASVGLKGGNPWCAAFVYWCAVEAAGRIGLKACPLLKTGSTMSMRDEYGRRGWFVEKGKAQPGDIFLQSHGGGKGHTGIIESTRDGGLVLCTIEGNTNDAGSREGDGLYRKRRAVGTIGWVVRVP